MTTNIKTQRISGTKRGDGLRAHSDPLPGCFYIFNTEDVALSSHQPCLAFHWSAGETGAACQKPFFGSQDFKVCVYREIAFKK